MTTHFLCDLTLLGTQIRLVANDDDGDPVCALVCVSVLQFDACVGGVGAYKVIENLITQYADHLKGLLGGERVNKHVAVDTDEVLGV